VDYKEKIMEIIDRTKLAATYVSNGMNIMTMEIAETHRIMQILLNETGQIIHDTMKAEINGIYKQKRTKRDIQTSTLGRPRHKRRLRRNSIESILPKGHTVNTLDMIDKTGLLPNDVSTGLKALSTARNTIDDLSKASKAAYQRLSNNNPDREGEEFRRSLMEQIGSQNRDNNKRTTTVDEGDMVNIPCFPDEDITDTSKVVWMRSDGGLLHNFEFELKSNKLYIKNTECDHKGEYKCGFKDGEVWNSYNLDSTWNIHGLNIICDTEKRISVAPNTVIGVEGGTVTLQCSAPTNSTVQWTKTSGINKDQFSRQAHSTQLQAVTTNDAGIYTCTHTTGGKTTEERIILQIHKLSVDGTSEQMKSLGFLEAFDCTKEIIKKSSVDLTRTGKCSKNDYMAYEPEQSTTVELIHHRTSEENLVDACHLTIQLST
jgi:hypothetical protein